MSPANVTDFSGAVFAIVGAAVSLGGLLLVFSGFLYSRAASFPSTTDDRITDRFRRVASLGLIPFTLSLTIAAAGSLYYRFESCTQFVNGIFFGFVILCAVTIIYGIAASRFL